jgi:flagellar secretion chaperone FliS
MTLAAHYRTPAAHGSVAVRTGLAATAPHGLIEMLIHGALERIACARGRLEQRQWAEKSLLLRSAVVIIGELRANLDLRAGGAVAANLDDLYDYMCRQLRAANLQNRIATLDEVSHLLCAIREAWVVLPAQVRAVPGD